MKKNSPDHTASLKKLDFLDDIEEHAVVLWFSQNWQKLLYGFLAAFLLLFSVYAWKARGISKSEIDYYDANQIFLAFQANTKNEESFVKLDQLLNRLPDLHAKYDGLIAQTLIDRGQIAEAVPYAQQTLKRIGNDHLPFYVDFSAISLMIANHHDADALARSSVLKQNMLDALLKNGDTQSTPSFGMTLFAINLLRIGMLEQKIGSPAGELAAWKEWQNYANGNLPDQAKLLDNRAFFTLANGISEGKASLQDYINLRVQELDKH